MHLSSMRLACWFIVLASQTMFVCVCVCVCVGLFGGKQATLFPFEKFYRQTDHTVTHWHSFERLRLIIPPERIITEYLPKILITAKNDVINQVSRVTSVRFFFVLYFLKTVENKFSSFK
jgi:hypothetical protein